MKKIVLTICLMIVGWGALATDYSYRQCEGSLIPYPKVIGVSEYPDSLVPVFINHVGRHGSRYPASDAHCKRLQHVLNAARRLGTITALGRRLEALNDEIIRRSEGRWGDLDSLGRAEQAGIAERMFENYPEIFQPGAALDALSSYSPRSIESMQSFMRGERGLDERVKYSSAAGKQFSGLVRPFDVCKAYLDFRADKVWEPVYMSYYEHTAPIMPIERVLGEKYPFKDKAEARELALTEYYVLAGCSAMSMANSMSEFFTKEEANALWSCFNLRQYLQRSASRVSTVPADIAAELVKDIIATTDKFIAEGGVRGVFRFGHGETILPLVSLLRLNGCYYLTDNYTSVAEHWHDFEIIPMAANVQFVVFRSKETGKHYVRIFLNERPITIESERQGDLYDWDFLRAYMISCLPK